MNWPSCLRIVLRRSATTTTYTIVGGRKVSECQGFADGVCHSRAMVVLLGRFRRFGQSVRLPSAKSLGGGVARLTHIRILSRARVCSLLSIFS